MNPEKHSSLHMSAVEVVRRSDGSVLIDNAHPLPPVTSSIFARLGYWAARTPTATWLSEGNREISYVEADIHRRDLSARLLSTALGPASPLMIIAHNGIDHALFMLAATAIGVPVAIVSPAYVAAGGGPWSKLERVLAQIEPGLILADDPAPVRAALRSLGHSCKVEALADRNWVERLAAADGSALHAAEQAVDDETVAKLLFTSGSTGVPKAVIITQRMMASNMAALSVVWPFLTERPPMMVDWLPWNHIFGGNCCFNLALWFGGHMHIDKGRPIPGAIDHSISALRAMAPTLYFNVPLGYELLLPALEQDAAFARKFFGGLDFIFNGGAPMPGSIRARIEQVALAATGRLPRIVGGWGSTETAPFATFLDFPTEHAANLGVPIPGTTLKLIPQREGFELRVRGPNVTPGYWRDPEASAATFDEEGFYRIGDAGKFADPSDPGKGIVFDGRVTENFKLSSGTFVNVGALRLAIINAGEKLINDVVVAGEGRSELGLLVFANDNACRDLLGAMECAPFDDGPIVSHDAIVDRIGQLLRAYNAGATGSSLRIARFRILHDPPSAADDEITDKGYLNQRRILTRRAADVERLFTESPPL